MATVTTPVIALIPSFRPIAPVSPEDLCEKIQSTPALAALAATDCEFVDSLLAASRLAQEARSFKEVFADADEARVAAEGNAELSALVDLLFDGETPEHAQRFYARLMVLSHILDEDGNAMKDQSGQPISDGSVGLLIENTGALFLNYFDRYAETSDDSALTAAVATLRAAAFSQRRALGIRNVSDEKLARINAWKDSIVVAIDEAAFTAVHHLLSHSNVVESERASLAIELRKELEDQIVANPQFRREQDLLMRHNWGEKTRRSRIDLGKKWIDRMLPLIAPAFIEARSHALVTSDYESHSTQSAEGQD